MAALTDTDAPEPIGAAPINFVNRTFVAAAQPFWAEVSGKVETLRAEWSAALKSITAAPTSLTSAGIVTVVTADTFEIALTGVRMLREAKCTIPVEMWHVLGDVQRGEAPLEWLSIKLVAFNATMFEPTSQKHFHFTDEEIAAANIETLKYLAIRHSSFAQVLYLDPGVVPTKAIDLLFGKSEYTSRQAVIWPSYFKTSERNPISRIIDGTSTKLFQQDSRIIMLDKQRKWPELVLAAHFSSATYVKMMGSNAGLQLACIALKSNCAHVAKPAAPLGMNDDFGRFCGHSKLQFGLASETLFVDMPFRSRDEVFDVDFRLMQVAAALQSELLRRRITGS